MNAEFSWYYSSRICNTYDVQIPIKDRIIINPIIESLRKQSAGTLTEKVCKCGGAWERSMKINKRPTIISGYEIAKDFPFDGKKIIIMKEKTR